MNPKLTLRCSRCDGPLLGSMATVHRAHPGALLCCLCHQRYSEWELEHVRLSDLGRLAKTNSERTAKMV